MPDVLAWGAAVVVASSASAIVVWAISRFRPRWITDHGNTACVTAVVVGAVLGHAELGLWPQWPPSNALDRFLTIVLPAAVVLQLIGNWLSRRRWLQWVLEGCFALVVGRILLHRSVYLQDGVVEPIVILAVSAALLVAVQSSMTRLWIRTRQAAVPIAIAFALLTAGLLVLMAGYIKGGTAAFPWAAALAGAALLVSLRTNLADLQGVTQLAVVVLFGVLFIGRFFGALTTETAVLVFVTPLLCWVPEWPVFRSIAPPQRACLRLSLVAAALLVILWSAKQTFDREMGPLLSEVGGRATADVETTYASGERHHLGQKAYIRVVEQECRFIWSRSCWRMESHCDEVLLSVRSGSRNRFRAAGRLSCRATVAAISADQCVHTL